MVHGIVILLFAAELVWVASGLPSPLSWMFGYFALSFGIVGIAYLTGQPKVFGKTSSGKFPIVARILYLPFHVVAALSSGLRRLRGGNEAFNQVTDDLWLGDRTAVPDAAERIVDLTVEHPRVGPGDVDYIAIPTLDGQAPDEEAMRSAIERMSRDPRPTYVHCFAGRGRSATFVAAYLLDTGAVRTVEEAEELMRAKRPVVRLGDSQREVARAFER